MVRIFGSAAPRREQLLRRVGRGDGPVSRDLLGTGSESSRKHVRDRQRCQPDRRHDGPTSTGYRHPVRKADEPTGALDDSFGQGTKEDTAVPTVMNGSIPPQKSDLLNFGLYLETTASGPRFLNLYWHRVQEPNGTTNMDFEFNKSLTPSANGVTPVRTAGDLLIQYDLAQGGTNPQLFLSRWVTRVRAHCVKRRTRRPVGRTGST